MWTTKWGLFFINFVMFTSTIVGWSVDWLVGWLIILLPGAGWDIMGYESDPLPSYPELRNCSYSVKLITPLPRLFLRIVYCVLIPSEHHPASPRNYLRLCAQCIYRPAGHPLHYIFFPTLVTLCTVSSGTSIKYSRGHK